MTEEAAQSLVSKVSQLCSEALGKPEQYMVVNLEYSQTMIFGGSFMPTAFIELRSIHLPPEAPAKLSPLICNLINDEVGISAERIYINFKDMPPENWGWNGKTFA